MSAVLTPGRAAALPDCTRHAGSDGGEAAESTSFEANRGWEIDRALVLERSERRAWWVALAGLILGLIGIAAVFVQGPLRRVVEIPIVVDRVTGEATIQQRLSVETIPPMEALDKHNLATFVRARESYSWMFLQRDFDQVARMAVPVVFNDYNRQFEGDAALQKKMGASEDWRINVVGVRRKRWAPAKTGGSTSSACAWRRPAAAATVARPPSPTTRWCGSLIATCLT